MFGFDVKVLILTKNELKNVIDENPLKKEDPKHIYITFLSEHPSENIIKDLKLKLKVNIKNKSEKVSISLMKIYSYLPDGYGRTKLNNNFSRKS